MATAIQELKNLSASDVAAKLGGIKGGAADWRIPDLCGGETQVGDNPPFSLWMEAGAMHWWCHKHDDAETSTEALRRALFYYLPTQQAPPPAAMPTASYKTISIDKFVELLGSECPNCGRHYEGQITIINGWPILNCPVRCIETYDTLLKAAVAKLEEGWKVRFVCEYQAQGTGPGITLKSERLEPGKIISGTGSNATNHPVWLTWGFPNGRHIEETPIIVEGEKAAAAVASLGYRGISWRGGKGAWQHTAWPRNHGPFIIWPDNHPDARQAMVKLAQHLDELGNMVYIVPTFGDDNKDVADYYANEVEKGLAQAQQLNLYQLPAEDQGPEEEEVPEIILEWWCRSGGLNDVRRLIRYYSKDLAYYWEPGVSSESPSLVMADEVGYWRAMGRKGDYSRLNALIIHSRQLAIDEATVMFDEATIKLVERQLKLSIGARDQNDAKINLGTPFHEGTDLPVFQANMVMLNRNLGLLTLQTQCIDMANGSLVAREDVLKYGIMYDAGWSPYKWKPGAYWDDNNDAANIRKLVANLGDSIKVITEMLMQCDRRIALLKSKSSGRGKSIIVALLKQALGNLVRVGDASNLTDRAMNAQFPAAHNMHTKGRIVVYPEVDKNGLEKLSIGGLVTLSGEPYLSSEEKFEDRIERPRIGNPFVTMGQWIKTDAKGTSLLDWNVQGIFDKEHGRGRLWAWDIDEAGGEYLPEYAYYSCLSDEGCEAFIDLLIETASDGVPEIYTQPVLEFVYGLLEASSNESDAGETGSAPIKLSDQRIEIVRDLFVRTDEYDDIIHVLGLAQAIDQIRRKDRQIAMAGTDTQWQAAIRAAFDLPSLRNHVMGGQQNKREHDGFRRNYPIRGFVLLSED